MIFARTNTYGVETKIYLIQQYLQAELLWFTGNGGNLENYQIRIFGRLYPNDYKGVKRADVYLMENGKDYDQRLASDKSIVQIAFYVKDRDPNLGNNTAEIDIIFTANVNEVYNNNRWETERMLLEAEKILRKCPFIGIGGEKITDINEMVENVFADFDVDRKRHQDKAPKWVFSFTTEVDYSNDSCKTRTAITTGTVFTADNNTITVDNNSITVDQILL